jgi:hypothetical protein
MDLSFSIDAAEEALQDTAVRKSSTPVWIVIHDCSAEFASVPTTNGISGRHGRQGRLARQRLRRALLASH